MVTDAWDGEGGYTGRVPSLYPVALDVRCKIHGSVYRFVAWSLRHQLRTETCARDLHWVGHDCAEDLFVLTEDEPLGGYGG